MRDLAVRVENLGKRYRIGGRFRYRALRDTLTEAIYFPFRRLISTPRSAPGQPADEKAYIWALRGVSFEIKQGEVVGIIGRNGAGKTTLLKILSRITEPTEGEVKICGRVGSLLEVGTGFHPELTGRENIYLNGAILGMKKAEIDRKFDEIVAFAEVEKFIDTPVKHYSSGMYVRLAFAVAAHLEPEILLVDEVLAVGDAAFQKKCLGKMGDVAKAGRTVLVVSHNMGMVRFLCQRSILLADGEMIMEGRPEQVIAHYLSSRSSETAEGEIEWPKGEQAPGDDSMRLRSIRLVGPLGTTQGIFGSDQPIRVEITYRILKPVRGMRFVLGLLNQEGILAFASTNQNLRDEGVLYPGCYRTCCVIPEKLLNRGRYVVRLSADIPGVKKLMPGQELISFAVEDSGTHGSYFPESWPGVLAPLLTWEADQRIEAEGED
jgi:lipopolysaccharide transport system ATP-binding protein